MLLKRLRKPAHRSDLISSHSEQRSNVASPVNAGMQKRLMRFWAGCLVSLCMSLLIGVQPAQALEPPDWFPFFKGNPSETLTPKPFVPAPVELPLTPEDTLPEIVEDRPAIENLTEDLTKTAEDDTADRFVADEAAAPGFALKEAYFGDTHVHTSWSPDAFSSGTRTTPRDAYAYAKGAAIDHTAGYKIQLKEPLDFYMVTDHSEYMGILPKTQDPENTVLYNTEVAKLLRSPDPEDREKGLLTVIGSITGSVDKIPEFVNPEISQSVWQEIVHKESFGTTGPRIQVRLFGGWDYTDAEAKSNDFVRIGYEKGVPMGGDLAAKPAAAPAPTFMVAAMKDSNTANLDRIQIVKGWSKHGQSYERVYDVALADGRKVDPKTGKAPPVVNTVDIAKATYQNTIGDAQLSAFWSDPDFDPKARAFYYARVLEIPTPRWNTYDALKLGIPVPDDLPATIQERAYTSPIWYTPSEDLLAQVRQTAMTVASLKTQGAQELSTREIKNLIVNKRVKIKNIPTGELLEAFYRPDGKRTLTNLATFAGFHGGLGGTTNPYTIEDNMLSSSFEDGSKFSSRIYQLNGK